MESSIVPWTHTVTIDELIDEFMDGKQNLSIGNPQKPGPIRIINGKIYSFDSVICERSGDKYIIYASYFSSDTETAQLALLKRIPKDKQIVVGSPRCKNSRTY